MSPGMRTSSFPGSVEEALLDLRVEVPEFGGFARVELKAAPGYGARHYALYANARRAGTVWVPEGEAARATVPAPAGAGDLSVHAEDLGDWPGHAYDPAFTARDAESGEARQLTLAWRARPAFVSRGDALGQLTNWNLEGVKRFSNSAAVERRPTRAAWNVELRDDSGTRTVRLYAGAAAVAEGSRAGDGTVVLGALNGSGLSGSVELAYAADAEPGGIGLEARFPARYEIHYALGSLEFPREAEAEWSDDGRSNAFRWTSGPLEAGKLRRGGAAGFGHGDRERGGHSAKRKRAGRAGAAGDSRIRERRRGGHDDPLGGLADARRDVPDLRRRGGRRDRHHDARDDGRGGERDAGGGAAGGGGVSRGAARAGARAFRRRGGAERRGAGARVRFERRGGSGAAECAAGAGGLGERRADADGGSGV
ncbi:MAG: hypothetical protein M5U26_16865 [Planctomycetota bacterium]|nr:hypothetical protein [Planctomycetota bacterium]